MNINVIIMINTYISIYIYIYIYIYVYTSWSSLRSSSPCVTCSSSRRERSVCARSSRFACKILYCNTLHYTIILLYYHTARLIKSNQIIV